MGLFASIEWEDEKDPNYADSFFEQDTKWKEAEQLVDYLIDEAATQALIDMLKMKTGDLSDGIPLSKRIGYFKKNPITKTKLRTMSKNRDIVVVRTVPEPELKKIIEESRIADYLVNEDHYTIVDNVNMRNMIHDLIEKGDFNIAAFYERDERRTRSWKEQILNTLRRLNAII